MWQILHFLLYTYETEQILMKHKMHKATNKRQAVKYIWHLCH